MVQNTTDNRPIRLGMVGGGRGAFIGAIHRLASRLDGHYQLVAGAFSATPEKSVQSGLELGIEADRCYTDFTTMAQVESARDDSIEAVIIVTPNHMHFDPIKTFLQAHIHVFCDKPMTATLQQAQALQSVIDNTQAYFVLTHNYSANALIRQARAMVKNGDLGTIRIVQAEYIQGWLAQQTDIQNKQALWRTDPAQSGAGAIGDIGSHTHQLMCYVSGLQVSRLYANLTSFVTNRRVDDDAQVLLEFCNGAKGMLWATQVAEGYENDLKIRICGTKGSIEWEQQHPNHMWYYPIGAPKQLLTRAGMGATPENMAISRTPAGHPEGYLEAFANIYRDMAPIIKKARTGKTLPIPSYIPNFNTGLNGMQFIYACQHSSKTNQWVSLP